MSMWDSTTCVCLLACVQRYYPEILPESHPLMHVAGRNLFWAAMKMAAKKLYVDRFWLPISSCFH